MENVFNYLKTNDNFSMISKLIDESQSYLNSDPQASILKISSVLEIIVNKLIEQEGISAYSNELNSKINSLKGRVLDRAIFNMHTIRSVRNASAAHVSYSTNSIRADKTESMYCTKMIYELLAWYVNFDSKKKVDFITFEEYIGKLLNVSSEKVVDSETKDIEQFPSTKLPKFFIDYEFQLSFKGKSVEELEEKDLMEVLSLFFKTNYDLKTIERMVFKNDKPDGNIVYAILMFYKMAGITNSWRKFVQKNGLEESAKLISELEPSEIDIEVKHRLNVLKQILSNTKQLDIDTKLGSPKSQ